MTDGTWNRKGIFQFPETIRSLIDLFLDPVVRQARHRVHQRIERQIPNHGARQVAKAVANLQAIRIQAERTRQQNRVQRR